MAAPLKAATAVLTMKMNTGAYGTDAVPTASANRVLAFDVDINPMEMELDEHNPVTHQFGGGEKIIGARWCTVKFSMLLCGGGVPVGNASQAPNCDPVLRSSAMSRIVTAGVNISYLNIDAAEEDSTLYYHVGGLRQKVVGLRGGWEVDGTIGKAIKLNFSGLGINVPMGDDPVPAFALPTTPRPVAMNFSNTGITIGGTYTAKVSSIKVRQGNDVQYMNRTGREEVGVMDRQMSGSMLFELPLVAEKDFLGANGICTLGTPVALFMTHSTTPGNSVLMDMPTVQLLSPKIRAEKKALMIECDLHIVRNTFAFIFL